jgi:hypothetical protein
MVASVSGSFPSRGKSPSAARLRAQRANAERSTGPRTLAGRRRSALNRLGWKASDRKMMAWLQPQDRQEFLKVWRDLRALFWFVPEELWREHPRLEFYLQGAATAWHSKLLAARKGFFGDGLNLQIESQLYEFALQLHFCQRKARYWCRKEFGADGSTDIQALRARIEARLGTYSQMAEIAKKGAPKKFLSNPNPHLADKGVG